MMEVVETVEMVEVVTAEMAVKEAVEMEGEEAMVQVSMQDFGWDI